MKYCFNDVLITPKFSHIKSRKDVDTTVDFLGKKVFPVISSNMDSVTSVLMANAMHNYGAMACLHRFWTIDQNVEAWKQAKSSMVSVGVGDKELTRFEALYDAGATQFIVDVAHGAAMHVVEHVREMRKLHGNKFDLIVGNFANARSIKDFQYHFGTFKVDAWKVGIGGGSACLTRVVTGCGMPTLASIGDCAMLKVPLIADGGMCNSGDIAKALGAGSSCVMLGGMLAGADESPGYLVDNRNYPIKPDNFNTDHTVPKFKKYRGSASQESYEIQGKVADHRAAEGDSFLVPYTGPVKDTLQQIDAGLRSAMSYVGAANLTEFQEVVVFEQVSQSGAKESTAHGKL